METIEARLIRALRTEDYEERCRLEDERREGRAAAMRSLAAAHVAWSKRFMPHTLREDHVPK